MHSYYLRSTKSSVNSASTEKSNEGGSSKGLEQPECAVTRRRHGKSETVVTRSNQTQEEPSIIPSNQERSDPATTHSKQQNNTSRHSAPSNSDRIQKGVVKISEHDFNGDRTINCKDQVRPTQHRVLQPERGIMIGPGPMEEQERITLEDRNELLDLLYVAYRPVIKIEETFLFAASILDQCSKGSSLKKPHLKLFGVLSMLIAVQYYNGAGPSVEQIEEPPVKVVNKDDEKTEEPKFRKIINDEQEVPTQYTYFEKLIIVILRILKRDISDVQLTPFEMISRSLLYHHFLIYRSSIIEAAAIKYANVKCNIEVSQDDSHAFHKGFTALDFSTRNEDLELVWEELRSLNFSESSPSEISD